MKAVDSDQLLRHIPAIDQEDYKSHTHPLNCDQPRFYWIFKNMDLERWYSANYDGLEALWLSGPAESQISDASSRIVDLAREKPSQAQHLVLYFFCSTVPTEASISIIFVSTIMDQLIRHLPRLKGEVTMVFLRALLDTILRDKPLSDPEWSRFKSDDSSEAMVKKVLEASSNGYWHALRAVMDIVHEQELSLIIDGLKEAGHQRREFIQEIYSFLDHLRERHSTTRVLLTSQPQAEIEDIFGRLSRIEYDREREGLTFLISYSLGR